jgi:uncharacterized membrane protein
MDLEAVGTLAATIVKRLDIILISICQLLALFVIAVGVSRALLIYLKGLITHVPSAEAFQQSRLTMGYAFSLGLSFLVGATILKTMNSSRWEDIAQLAAIIAVRTILNYLLLQAIRNSDRIQEPDELPNGIPASANAKAEMAGAVGRVDA